MLILVVAVILIVLFSVSPFGKGFINWIKALWVSGPISGGGGSGGGGGGANVIPSGGGSGGEIPLKEDATCPKIIGYAPYYDINVERGATGVDDFDHRRAYMCGGEDCSSLIPTDIRIGNYNNPSYISYFYLNKIILYTAKPYLLGYFQQNKIKILAPYLFENSPIIPQETTADSNDAPFSVTHNKNYEYLRKLDGAWLYPSYNLNTRQEVYSNSQPFEEIKKGAPICIDEKTEQEKAKEELVGFTDYLCDDEWKAVKENDECTMWIFLDLRSISGEYFQTVKPNIHDAHIRVTDEKELWLYNNKREKKVIGKEISGFGEGMPLNIGEISSDGKIVINDVYLKYTTEKDNTYLKNIYASAVCGESPYGFGEGEGYCIGNQIVIILNALNNAYINIIDSKIFTLKETGL